MSTVDHLIDAGKTHTRDKAGFKGLNMYHHIHYCTISIDSAWGVTCDLMDKILATSNVGVTGDMV